MAHILVAGAAGFIGARVTGLLLAQGQRVTGVDNLNDAYDVRLKRWRLEQLTGEPNFTFLGLDIRDREAVAAGVPGDRFDAVINLAARAGVRPSVVDPWVYLDTNVTGTLNLLELCRARGVSKFVLASSSSVYGAGNPVPFHEDSNTDYPLSPYAASKKAAEALCYSYHHLHGIDITAFRYFTVYGPAGRPDMAPLRFVQWISEGRPVTVYGDGQQSRDFTYVDDIARGTIAGLKPVGYEIVNLGSDRPLALVELIRQIETLTGKSAELRRAPADAADMRATWADIRKAKRLLDWQPEVSFEEGVSRLVEWYRANRAWASEIVTG